MRNMILSEAAECMSESYIAYLRTLERKNSPDHEEGGELCASEAHTTNGKTPNLKDRIGEILVSNSIQSDKVIQINSELEDNPQYTGFLAVRPISKILDSRYLYWYFRSNRFEYEKQRISLRGHTKKLSAETLNQIEIPIPSISEQSRISAVLDKIDGIYRKVNFGLTLVEDLVRSHFLTRFGSPLSNNKGLPQTPLFNFASIVSINGHKKHSDSMTSDNPPNIKYSDNSFYVSRIISRRNKDIVVTYDRSAFREYYFQVIPNSNTSSSFLFWQLKLGQELLKSKFEGTSQLSISKRAFESTELLAPNKVQQFEFDEFCCSVKQIELNLKAECDKCAEMLNEFSQRAFNGTQ